MTPITFDQCNVEKIDNGFIVRFNGTTPSGDPNLPPQWHGKTVFVASADELADTIKNLLGS